MKHADNNQKSLLNDIIKRNAKKVPENKLFENEHSKKKIWCVWTESYYIELDYLGTIMIIEMRFNSQMCNFMMIVLEGVTWAHFLITLHFSAILQIFNNRYVYEKVWNED